MFRALALVAVRQKHHQTRRKIPFVFGGADELVDDHLRAVYEIAELRLPENQSFRIVAAETIFKTDASSLGKRRVINLAKCAVVCGTRTQMGERGVFGFRLAVDEHGMALIESSALRV